LTTAQPAPVTERAAAGRGSDTRSRLLRNRVAVGSAAVLIALVIVAILAPLIAPYPYDAQDRSYTMLPAPADLRHRLGTDNLGQDMLSRLVYGARVSLSVGLLVEAIELMIGITLGLLAAYKGGRWDTILMRVTDAMFAFPDLLFAILLVGIFAPTTAQGSLLTVFVALALVNWPSMARLVRGQALSLRDREYVTAARAIGVTDGAIMWRHILPNMLSPIIVAATVDIANVILAEATLSFLGIGIQPPYPSWGRMISDGLGFLRSAPMQVFWPAIMLGVTVLALNFFGDALRDALDPRLRD
jgi:ABC-type dipeptide/oligopeptide/nickel transport system permease subunit